LKAFLTLEVTPLTGHLAAHHRQRQGHQVLRRMELEPSAVESDQKRAMDRLDQVEGVEVRPQSRAQQHSGHYPYFALVLLDQHRQGFLVAVSAPFEQIEELDSWLHAATPLA
jgi:hypothetical protein